MKITLRTTVRRTAAVVAATATVAGTAVLTAGTAQAGVYCTVIPHYAPIFEHPDPDSRVVVRIEAGREVAATASREWPSEWDMYRVYRADNGLHLGYMKPSHLDCSAG